MASTASIRVVKQFTYRDVVRTFSNRYHFDNSAPSDQTKWGTFSDAVVNAEKAIYEDLASGGAKIVATVGYAAGSEVPVYNKTYTTDGTATLSSGVPAPGDCAALIRYGTSARSSKNHPIYLFNYYHAVFLAPGAGTQDRVLSAQVTAMGTYASAWITGFSDGTTTHHRASPNGPLATGQLVETYIHHRDLPR
jgi:hypothetical protein